MNQREIFMDGDNQAWEKLADLIQDRYKVEVLQVPETCMVMLTATDTGAGEPFFLGELLISEAIVAIQGIRGYGYAQEHDYDRAMNTAMLEAALAAGLPESLLILDKLKEQGDMIMAARMREAAMIKESQVNFVVLEE